MNTFFVENVLNGIEKLKQLDPNCLLFGSKAHKYILNPPLGEQEILDIESKYNIKLPADYRMFLQKVGNGGAGPGYGMCGWGQKDTGGGMKALKESEYSPSKKFPHIKPWSGSGYLDAPCKEDYEDGEEKEFEMDYIQWEEKDEDWWKEYINAAGVYNGTAQLCHYGSGQTAFLVINGSSAGQVWNNLLCDEKGILPETHNGQTLSFENWYMNWLEKNLKELS